LAESATALADFVVSDAVFSGLVEEREVVFQFWLAGCGIQKRRSEEKQDSGSRGLKESVRESEVSGDTPVGVSAKNRAEAQQWEENEGTTKQHRINIVLMVHGRDELCDWWQDAI